MENEQYIKISPEVMEDYETSRQQAEKKLQDKLKPIELRMQELAWAAMGEFITAEARCIVYADFEYARVMSVQNIELQKLLAARALSYGGAKYHVWSKNKEIREAQKNALCIRKLQNLICPEMI